MSRRLFKLGLVALIFSSGALAIGYRFAYATAAASPSSSNPKSTAKQVAAQKSKSSVVIPANLPDIAPAPAKKATTTTTLIKPNTTAQTKLAAPQALTTSSDTTQPVGPTHVTASSQSIFSITASWDAASDPESGITEYIFGIGTVASGDYNTLANTQWWQVTYGTSMTANLSLDPSQTYYVSVYAVNGAGLSGSIVTSAAIHPVWVNLGQAGNNVSIAFAPTGLDANGNVIAGFTAAQITTMTNFYNNFYPLLKQVYGPPAVNYTVTIVRDLHYTNSNEFFPSTDEIHMSDTLYPQLFVHEFTHAFREKYILSSDQNWNYNPTLSGFEEGFAQEVSYDVMNLYVQAYPNDPIVAGNTLWGSSMDWDYDYQNVPEIRGTDFWSDGGGTLLYWTRYEVAAAAIHKINLESPGFDAAFNQKYYSLINANPLTVRPTQALITSIISSITPTIEGLPAATWIGQQNIFYDQNVYGDKIFHQIQDYPWNQFYAFQSIFFLNTMSCGSEWACYDGTQWNYYHLNGTSGTASLTDDNGNTIWSGPLQILPTTNPSDGDYEIGHATKGMTTASTVQPWPGGNDSDYIENLDTMQLYKFNTTFTDPNTGVTTSNSAYRPIGSQLENNFTGVWGGVIGHKNGTIYLNHVGYPAEPGIPVTNGAFVGTRLWAGVPDARTGGTDSVPGKVMVTFVDSDTGATYQAQRNIDYGSVDGNQMFLFDFSGGSSQDSISVSTPQANATVYGTTTLTATPSAGTSIASVQFSFDGQAIGNPVTTAPYSTSWDTTAVSDGTHVVTAVATTTLGTTLTSNPVSVTTANNPPTVSLSAPAGGAVVTGTVPVSAAVTSNSGVAKVEFYSDSGNLIGTATTSPYSVNWSTSGLVQGSSHSLYAIAYAGNGETTTSSAITVSIKDTTAPTVSVTAPSAGAVVYGTTTLSATAVDNVGVAGVQFLIDGQNAGSQISSTPYSLSWNSTALADGSHSLQAVASDAAGNKTNSTTVTFTVANNPPTSTVNSPASGTAVTGTVAVTALVTSDSGLSKVEFYRDGTTLIGTDTSSPYTVNWNTSGLVQGSSHTLSAKAYALNGKTTTSALVTVTIKDTTAPTVSVTAPKANANIAATTSITASALDNIAVTKVEFYVDGKLLGTDTSSPYSFSWNPASAALGAHSLTAKAYDAAGNTATSAAISVKVIDSTAPTVSVTAPANNSQVSHSTNVSITASASDNRAVSKVEFYVNNVLKCTDTTASYSCSWAVPSQKGVKYTVSAKAYDSSGNTATATVTVTSK